MTGAAGAPKTPQALASPDAVGDMRRRRGHRGSKRHEVREWL